MANNNFIKEFAKKYIDQDLRKVELEDGATVINVSKNGTTKLGRFLSPEYPIVVDTIVFGKAGNVRNAIDFITIPGYPINLLSKPRLSPRDIGMIPKVRKQVPNYHAITAFLVGYRIIKDRGIVNLIYKNKLPYVSYSFREIDMDKSRYKYLGKTPLKVISNNKKMDIYLGVVRYLDELIKAYPSVKAINFEELTQKLDTLVENLMVNKEDLYVNTAPVTVKQEEATVPENKKEESKQQPVPEKQEEVVKEEPAKEEKPVAEQPVQ